VSGTIKKPEKGAPDQIRTADVSPDRALTIETGIFLTLLPQPIATVRAPIYAILPTPLIQALYYHWRPCFYSP
jgi:hypothetical protein